MALYDSRHQYGQGEPESFRNRMLAWVTRIIFPEVCAGCGVSGTWMCSACEQELARVNPSSACWRCGQPDSGGRLWCSRCIDWGDVSLRTRSVFRLDGPARDAVHLLKYNGQHARAEWCAHELAGLITRLGWEADIITSVPLTKRRFKTRGYNQAEKIADNVAGLLGMPYQAVLARTRETRPQVGLSGAERQRNVDGAFRVQRPLAGRSLILVDDVLTTGATMLACARACAAAGAEQVYGVTVAVEVPEGTTQLSQQVDIDDDQAHNGTDRQQ